MGTLHDYPAREPLTREGEGERGGGHHVPPFYVPLLLPLYPLSLPIHLQFHVCFLSILSCLCPLLVCFRFWEARITLSVFHNWNISHGFGRGFPSFVGS